MALNSADKAATAAKAAQKKASGISSVQTELSAIKSSQVNAYASLTDQSLFLFRLHTSKKAMA